MLARTASLEATLPSGKQEVTTGALREKHRVQLEFHKQALEQLDQLYRAAGLSSRADAIRYSLKLFQWFTEQTKSGSQILVKKKDGEVREVVLLPIQG